MSTAIELAETIETQISLGAVTVTKAKHAAAELRRLAAVEAERDEFERKFERANELRHAALSERDALRADADECDALRAKLSDTLTRTAEALRGPPEPLTAWSWHDLPEIAAGMRAEVQRLTDDRDSWRNQASARTADATQFARERDDARAEVERLRSGEPFGQVAVYKVDHPNHHTTYEFYPWPQSPYLDNARECHTVYLAPPRREPLTPEQIDDGWRDRRSQGSFIDSPRSFVGGIKFAEKMHGIGTDTKGQG